MPDVPAHDQHETIHLLCHYPAHEPRQSDSHYHLFEAARRRIKAAGLWRCAIDGCTFPGPLEAHHEKIEFAMQGGVDLDRFNRLYGLHLIDSEFADYIEGEGNLEILCPVHHRTHMGVHSLPAPLWNAVRVWRADFAPPAEVV